MDTAAIIEHVIKDTYGNTEFVGAAVQDVANTIDKYNLDADYRTVSQRRGRTREDVTMLKLWDWFSGGTTAENAAKRVEAALAEYNR
jgi:hypothetical protein